MRNKMRIPHRAQACLGRVGNPRKQRGQVMPMTVIFIAAVLLSLWVMYDSGRVMTEKIKLQNTADNVAYSAAALVARDLNFIAYTNRAMIANQVAIGQMVGLSSWASMMERLGVNLDYLGSAVSWIPVIGQIIKSVTQAIKAATQALASATDAAAELVIGLNNTVTIGISEAQYAFHTGVMATMQFFPGQIAQKNDPEAQPVAVGVVGTGRLVSEMAQSIGQQYEHPGPSSSQTTRRRYKEFHELVGQSRDPFTTQRSFQMGFPLSGSAGLVSWETIKRGGSELIRSMDGGEYEWHWTAMDTMGFELEFELPWPLDDFELEMPLAWGAAHALDNDGPSFDYPNYQVYGGAWDDTAAAAGWAYVQDVEHEVQNIDGLQPFYAFRDKDQAHMYGPGYIAFYRKSAANMSLLDDDGDSQGMLDTGSADSFITATAKARPYFARPTDLAQFARLDGNFEYGNLYNPFWQPRLVELSNAEKAALMAIAH